MADFKEEIRKRNSRLETFLKHMLRFDEYERIRAHEACIVCSEKESRAFKFMALDDRWIYLMENPPKTLNRVIHFRDVVFVSMTTDQPDFLTGAEKENAQHVTIGYLTDEKPKLPVKIKSEDELSTKPKSDDEIDEASNSATVLSEEKPDRNQGKARYPDSLSITARWRSESGLGLTSRKVTFSFEKFASDFRPMPVKSSRMSAEDELLNSKDELLNGKVANGVVGSVEKKTSNRVLKDFSKMKSDKRLGKSLDAQILREALNKNNNNDDDARTMLERAMSEMKKWSRMSSRDESFKPYLADLTEHETNHVLVPPLDLHEMTSTSHSILRTSSSQSGGSLHTAILHLYFLNKTSILVNLIKCAWTSCLLKCTIEEDHEFMLRLDAFPPKLPSEKLELRFNLLRSDLLNPDNTLEDLFNYLQELRDGTERNFILKKFFWKCPETFLFLVSQLALYLPVSKHPVGRYTRADQIELALLIIETLSMMLRESEIFSTRMVILKCNNGLTLKQLIILLVSTVRGHDEHERDEVKNFIDELTDTKARLLHELIEVAEQTSWCDGTDSFFKVLWIAGLIESIEYAELSTFVEQLIKRAFYFISSAGRKTDGLISQFIEHDLTPQEVLTVYFIFYVLNALTFYGMKTLNIIKEKFYEEFKYFIRLPVKQVPSYYVISSRIQGLIRLVVTRVIGNDVIVKSAALSAKSSAVSTVPSPSVSDYRLVT